MKNSVKLVSLTAFFVVMFFTGYFLFGVFASSSGGDSALADMDVPSDESKPSERKLEGYGDTHVVNESECPVAQNATSSLEPSRVAYQEPITQTIEVTDIAEGYTEHQKRINGYSQQAILGEIQFAAETAPYDVVRGTDNELYVGREIESSNLQSASIFLYPLQNERQNGLRIYDANMELFAQLYELKHYTDPVFYESHPYIVLNMPDDDGLWEVFSFYRTDDEKIDETVLQNLDLTALNFEYFGEFYSYTQAVKANSRYENSGVTLNEDDKILTIWSYVDSSTSRVRYVLHAKLIQKT